MRIADSKRNIFERDMLAVYAYEKFSHHNDNIFLMLSSLYLAHIQICVQCHAILKYTPLAKCQIDATVSLSLSLSLAQCFCQKTIYSSEPRTFEHVKSSYHSERLSSSQIYDKHLSILHFPKVRHQYISLIFSIKIRCTKHVLYYDENIFFIQMENLFKRKT